jgi:Zn-dependent peptidase ImmA (M78 family)
MVKMFRTRKEIQTLIKEEGSAYKAARKLEITPQAFYERMQRAGVKPAGYKLFPGEPAEKKAKLGWLKDLLQKQTVKQLAKRFRVSESAIRGRMQSYGIRMQPDKEERIKKFKELLKKHKELLKKHKTGYALSKVLKVTPQSVYERMKTYGLKG